jgi:hypothetical protein
MKKPIKSELVVQKTKITVLRVDDEEYISLTDLARFKNADNPSSVITHYLSTYDTVSYIGLWETLSNPDFNSTEFGRIKTDSPDKSFTMTPSQWIKRTNAKGIVSKGGRYSLGTFVHSDIAFHFASWISSEFQLYLIKEFERLKADESYRNQIEWSVKRELAKTNYVIHTDAIKTNIVSNLTEQQKKFVYSDEADVLNVALFGLTAKEWREQNPKLDGNVRDYADILHLVVLSNLENFNAEMIKDGIAQSKRLVKLNETAKHQLNLLRESRSVKRLSAGDAEQQ